MDSKQNADEVITRLKSVVNVKSDRELAGYFGMGSTTITSKRQRGSVPYEECVQLALERGISLDWLILGKGAAPEGISSPAGDEGLRTLVPSGQPDGPGYTSVPMYDIEAAAGPGRLFEAENIEATVYFETDQLTHEGLDPAQVVGAKVRGDSMGETLRDGDKVLIDRSQRKPDGVFLLRMGQELRIKRVQRVAGGALMLISDNPHYEREMIRPEEMGDVELIGRCQIRIGRIA
ncbi:Phage repressor protein C, contains Cro/C1-type HTH and peptisase s24 domains [Modicisalibacter ilicicola DSM 19980]|uniref:Phage repressor protein C, contains Cro/C1-type HTH and peptisase s24 domains n=1 Tax=Modicisalibacter ilicicola DSM 19980 TaxID=1121942 RepID=A0A1M4Y2Z8_9GAMM|nr:LexA family transcriptional regulator [Halomonas ilicicola]SHE99852.1 Phage repressor protein C, contains Cro/C1-type HTH and peptisase s24 domains [Halomonas ilicicola DSM 19980]